jgi:hypothetical protein
MLPIEFLSLGALILFGFAWPTEVGQSRRVSDWPEFCTSPLSARHGSGNPTCRSIGCASAGRVLSKHYQNRPLNAWHSLGCEGASSSPIHAF